MSGKEQLRIKIYPNRMVVGIIGKDLFNSFTKYEYFGSPKDGYVAHNEPGLNLATAKLFGFKLAKTFLDGGGHPHTQIFTRNGELNE